MKYVLLIFVVINVSSCGNQSKNECAHPFAFDKATHYRLALPDSIVSDAYDFYFKEANSNQAPEQDLRFNREALAIAFDNSMSKQSDKSKVKSLAGIGFQRTEILKSRFAILDSMFCYLNQEPTEVAACEPIYRDLIVFEKDNKIIGWVKICLDCGISEIVGSKYKYNGMTYSVGVGKLDVVLGKE